MWKKLSLAVIASSVVLTGLAGCVVREVDHHPDYYDHRYYYDEDRDGIQNRYDRDRDGDGVPNWRDRYPDNPRYR